MPTVAAAEARFETIAAEFGDRYPAVIRLWRTCWPQFVPFLDYDHEVRKVLYTTTIIESLKARFRQATRRHGHLPTEQAAMKVLHLVVQQTFRPLWQDLRPDLTDSASNCTPSPAPPRRRRSCSARGRPARFVPVRALPEMDLSPMAAAVLHRLFTGVAEAPADTDWSWRSLSRAGRPARP